MALIIIVASLAGIKALDSWGWSRGAHSNIMTIER